MEKIIIILLFICVLFIGCAYGGEDSPDNVGLNIPSNMETIKEGDVNLVIYKGSKLHKQGDVLMTETTDEYASRKFSDTEEHFKKIEKELENTKKELEALKSAVKKLEEDGRKK